MVVLVIARSVIGKNLCSSTNCDSSVKYYLLVAELNAQIDHGTIVKNQH
jgi:hypothetical protein